MLNLLHKLWQWFYYGVLGNTSDVDLSSLPHEINITTHYDEKNEVYWVESDQLPDFEATGKTLELLAEHIGDAMLVYLDVPSYFAKNYVDGILTIQDPRSTEKQIIRISKTGIEKVFA